MTKVIFLKGLPASGKSTWAKQYTTSNNNWIRLNKDDLRLMFHNGVYSKDRESNVLSLRDNLIHSALKQKINVIVDDTNFNPYHEKNIKEIVSQYKNVTFEVKFFDVPLEECLQRNSQRTGTAKVPDDVIINMYNKYLKKEPVEEAINNPNNPHCIVCDLDGTLALMKDKRGPFDFNKVYEDEVNAPVWECLNSMRRAGFCIVFVSGRDDSCRKETERWLKDKCGFVQDYPLHMRKTGDRRKDCIVKEEIYKQKVLPHYYVQFVLDDRNQVVDHLRQMGLSVFQVAPGNF